MRPDRIGSSRVRRRCRRYQGLGYAEGSRHIRTAVSEYEHPLAFQHDGTDRGIDSHSLRINAPVSS
jgi:hypothetical protein